MIALYILLGLLFLLLLPFTGRFRFQKGEARFILRYAGVPVWRIKPGEKQENKPKKQKKTEKRSKKEKESPVKRLTAELKGQGVAGIVGFFAELARLAQKTMRRLFRTLHFGRCRVELAVGGGDAAAVAQRYGTLCGPVVAGQTLLLSALRIRRLDVDMRPDFCREADEVYVDFRLFAFPLALLWLGIRTVFSAMWLMIKINSDKGGHTNGQDS